MSKKSRNESFSISEEDVGNVEDVLSIFPTDILPQNTTITMDAGEELHPRGSLENPHFISAFTIVPKQEETEVPKEKEFALFLTDEQRTALKEELRRFNYMTERMRLDILERL